MELNLWKSGYYHVIMGMCEDDLKRFHGMMQKLSEDLAYSVEERTEALHLSELMNRQRDMPK